jgi:hypothetical protein
VQSVPESHPRVSTPESGELHIICPTCRRAQLRVVAVDLLREGVYLFACRGCAAVWEWETVA